jgi:para-aminobenzoate synthetase component 1
MAYYILKSYKLKLKPSDIFLVLQNERNCFFLDSSLNSNYSLGRFSFLGVDPFYILETKHQDPFQKLRGLLEEYKISLLKAPFPFLGGAVGYFAYDLGFLLEPRLAQKNLDDLQIPDCYLGFYNAIIILDHLKKMLYIFSLGFPEKTAHLAKSLCESNFKKIHALLCKLKPYSPNKNKPKPGVNRLQLQSNFNRQDYLLAVNKAKKYIKQGDIYQVNLSQRFKAKTTLSSVEIYERLRQISPSYFGAYLNTGDFQIMSSSPERFLSLRGNKVVTRPMKGTRPRGKDKRQDALLREELIKSAKDRAELTMIVDLERNDLGKVCDYSSIKVTKLRQLERYSTVFQTTATVEGRLYKDKDRVDLLRATFPGGSITGCPKIRAMEIIEELESSRRSIYTGSLGYLSFSGSMDFNILIRTILKKKDQLYFGVGGGIVTDSQPEAEYEETLTKAKGMIKAIS